MTGSGRPTGRLIRSRAVGLIRDSSDRIPLVFGLKVCLYEWAKAFLFYSRLESEDGFDASIFSISENVVGVLCLVERKTVRDAPRKI